MAKIGIYTFIVSENFIWDENNYENGGIGDSEIWAIKVSDEFAKHGYEVFLYGNPSNEHISKTGVHYLKQTSLNRDADSTEFDAFIFSRCIFDDIKKIKARKKILIVQEYSILNCKTFNDIFNLGITSIGYLSDTQRNSISLKYGIPSKALFKTSFGVDSLEYDSAMALSKKRNLMTFHGGSGRGSYWIADKVFPIVKKEIPDFNLVIINDYFDTKEITYLKDGITVINTTRSGKINLQCESKIWVYTNSGFDSGLNCCEDSFSLESLENGCAMNACIMANHGSIKGNFEGYEGFVGDELNWDDSGIIDYEDIETFYQKIAEDAIKCLKDENYRIKKSNSAYKCAIKNTWENVFKSLENEINSKNQIEMESNLKVLLCCIGRLENQYIREFVEYYKSLGVTNICLYDNNRDGEEDFNDVIGDYIRDGFVILKNYRNITTPVQFKAYNECYSEYKNDYDWFLFFDIDEFMFLNTTSNIKEYLSLDEFKKYDMIHINWLLFGDSGLVKNDGRPLLERLTQPCELNKIGDYGIPDNFHIKSIIRGGLNYMEFKDTPHNPFISGKCCNATGIECEKRSPFSPYDYRYAGLRHFTTKTAEEYSTKVIRGFCDGNPTSKQKLVEIFFRRNEVTEEKVNLFKEKCGIDVSYLLPIKFEGKKSDDVKIYSLCYSKKDFQFLDDEFITPLQVGAANGTDVCELKDNTLNNISNLNYFFVENTGTYWIWKNVTGAKYKGQMQYRRPLDGVSGKMDIEEIFKGHDVITCVPFNHPENSKPSEKQPLCIPAKTVEEGYGFSNCLDDLLILEMVIKMYYKDYADDYDKYIKKGENLYYSNGFILRADDYDKYAEFMYGCLNYYLKFSGINNEDDLINHVRYNLEVGKYIRYNKDEAQHPKVLEWQCKIGGFLSERIWTLWVLHNFDKSRIYEMPYIKMENNMYT